MFGKLMYRNAEQICTVPLLTYYKKFKMGERSSRNMYKGHMNKAKGVRIQGGKQGWVGGKWRPLYLNNNLIKKVKMNT